MKNIDTNKPNQLEVDIDILRESSADNYWERSDKFDTSIDLAYTKPGLDALARVIEKWIFHFLSIEVSVQPMQKIEDDKKRAKEEQQKLREIELNRKKE